MELKSIIMEKDIVDKIVENIIDDIYDTIQDRTANPTQAMKVLSRLKYKL